MNLQQTVQQASVQRLQDIDPSRMFVYEVDTPALIACATDSLDGAGRCYVAANAAGQHWGNNKTRNRPFSPMMIDQPTLL